MWNGISVPYISLIGFQKAFLKIHALSSLIVELRKDWAEGGVSQPCFKQGKDDIGSLPHKVTVSANVVQKWRIGSCVGYQQWVNCLISKGLLRKCLSKGRAPRLQFLQRFHSCISGLFRRFFCGQESATGVDFKYAGIC